MNIIVAADKKWCIGKNGDLLVRIPEDLKRFKEMTYGKIVVMGRKTYESLPKHLDHRINVVLTSSPDYSSNKGPIQVCTSVHNVLYYLECLYSSTEYTTNDVYIIGGGKVYEEFLPYCKYAYVTKVHINSEGDTYFPNIDKMNDWELEYAQISICSKIGITYGYYDYRNLNCRKVVL